MAETETILKFICEMLSCYYFRLNETSEIKAKSSVHILLSNVLDFKQCSETIKMEWQQIKPICLQVRVKKVVVHTLFCSYFTCKSGFHFHKFCIFLGLCIV
jgi:hypothetical protein